MTKHIFWIVAVVLVAASFTGSASVKQAPPPASPQVIVGPATTHAQVVSPQQALQAASQPGADTETAQGMTPSQAVGITPMAADGTQTCYFYTLWVEWNVWPYQQRVSQDTYWCGRGYSLTYRSTNVRLGTTACNASNAYSYKIAGGVPYFAVTVRASGTFSCGIPYIGGYHVNDWFDGNYDALGGAYVLRHS